jgi:hypothetical protein
MFSNIDLFELIGFIGSVLVAFSLTMSSILKLRWYNLAGASIFSIYGFLIGSMPVAFLNLFIAVTNIYYLVHIYKKKEHLKILMVRPENYYLEFFLDHYMEEILKFFPDFPQQRKILLQPDQKPFAVMILRDALVAGVVLGQRTPDNGLHVFLDFVLPHYRDLKPGKFLFEDNKEFFRHHKIFNIITLPKNKLHYEYLKKIGFNEKDSDGETIYMVKSVA